MFVARHMYWGDALGDAATGLSLKVWGLDQPRRAVAHETGGRLRVTFRGTATQARMRGTGCRLWKPFVAMGIVARNDEPREALPTRETNGRGQVAWLEEQEE